MTTNEIAKQIVDTVLAEAPAELVENVTTGIKDAVEKFYTATEDAARFPRIEKSLTKSAEIRFQSDFEIAVAPLISTLRAVSTKMFSKTDGAPEFAISQVRTVDNKGNEVYAPVWSDEPETKEGVKATWG